MAITPLDDAKNVRNSRLFSTALQTLLWCVALAVLGQNLLLLRQNRQLRDVASKKVQVKIENQVNPGSQLDDLTGINLYGVLTPIALPVTTTERLLIITMSPTCPICETNRRSWIEMTKDLKRIVVKQGSRSRYPQILPAEWDSRGRCTRGSRAPDLHPARPGTSSSYGRG